MGPRNRKRGNDVHNVKKFPLKDQNFSERFSQTVMPLIQKEINCLLNKGVITEVSEMEKKENKKRTTRKERKQAQVNIKPRTK